MISKETYTLNNGVLIPKIGLGTWFVNNDEATDLVKKAIDVGYTHIDTAQAYGNEVGIGKALQDLGKDREHIFLTSKVGAEHKTYTSASHSIDQSLKSLGLDYIDLMLIHSPEPWEEFHNSAEYDEANREVWKALEDAYKAGKLRAIGISNFRQKDIDNIFNHCAIKPMVNQLLIHVGNTPSALINYSKQHNMIVEAYSPIGHGVILGHPELKNIAQKYGVSVAQICIAYTLQQGLLPLPKATSLSHLQSNLVVDFEITKDDINMLKNIEKVSDYGKYTKFPVFSGK